MASVVEELAVQSLPCPSSHAVDKSVQVQRHIWAVCAFVSTGVWCSV